MMGAFHLVNACFALGCEVSVSSKGAHRFQLKEPNHKVFRCSALGYFDMHRLAN